ncbi:MAG: septation protein SpoVG family protein [Fibrobacterota bacterium]
MTVTNTNLTLSHKENSKRIAFGSIELDKSLVITGISVFAGSKGTFVKLPQFKSQKGYSDIAFPTNAALRSEINHAVLNKFNELLASKN